MRSLMKSGLRVSIVRLQEHEESLKEEYIEESKNLEEAAHEIREEAAHEIRELPWPARSPWARSLANSVTIFFY